MRGIRTVDWSDLSDEPISLSGIQSRHLPPERFRISWVSYEPTWVVPGTTRAGICYVLFGEFAFAQGSEDVDVAQGQVLYFSEGEFELRVPAHTRTEAVFVWELPPKFWSHGSA